jgi:Ras-related protein Rab-2A
LETIPRWVEAFREAVGPEPLLILLGNKADLEKKRKITRAQGEKITKDLNLFQYEETSAKTGHHVTAAFNTLASMIYKSHKSRKGP